MTTQLTHDNPRILRRSASAPTGSTKRDRSPDESGDDKKEAKADSPCKQPKSPEGEYLFPYKSPSPPLCHCLIVRGRTDDDYGEEYESEEDAP